MTTARLIELAGHRLTRPIEYQVERRFPGWVIFAPEFGMWGSGTSLYAAVSELTNMLLTQAQDLIYERPDETWDAARYQRRATWVQLLGGSK